MVDSFYATTMLAASERARDCRTRLEQLRTGGLSTAEHVQHAREQLDVARQRMRLALERADGRKSTAVGSTSCAAFTVGPVAVSRLGDVLPLDVGSFPARWGELDCQLRELWIEYVALGGQRSLLEVDAALHGAMILTDLDNMHLDQALWEREADL